MADRLAHDIAPADDAGAFARDGNPRELEHLHAACRRARHERGFPRHEAANIDRMETIDVLFRVDALDDLRRALREVRGQRKLHEDAVDAATRIEPVDLGEKILLRRRFGQGDQSGEKAERLARALLVAHINLRRRIFADDDDGKPRHPAEYGAQSQRLLPRLVLDLLGKDLAFEQSGCHISLPHQTYKLATVKMSMAMETMPLRMK